MSDPTSSDRKWKVALIVAIVTGPMLGALGAAWAAQTFPDVPPTNIFYDEIEWGAANNIINGYTNGKFGPNDKVTRGQAAAFLSHYNDSIHEVKSTVSPNPSSSFAHGATCPLTERPLAGTGAIGNSFAHVYSTAIVGRTFYVNWRVDGAAVVNPGLVTVTAMCAPYRAG